MDLYDVRLGAGTSAPLSRSEGRDTYVYVFEGAVELGGATLGHTESAIVMGGTDVAISAREDSVVVAFGINPDAPVTRQGTIGR